jgi:hypothetical protein
MEAQNLCGISRDCGFPRRGAFALYIGSSRAYLTPEDFDTYLPKLGYQNAVAVSIVFF